LHSTPPRRGRRSQEMIRPASGLRCTPRPRVEATPSPGFPELRLFHVSGSPKTLIPRNDVSEELLLSPWAASRTPRQTCARFPGIPPHVDGLNFPTQKKRPEKPGAACLQENSP
jgi:hypothetical protein